MPEEQNTDASTFTGRADPSQTAVVYAGDLADDDRLWAVRCSVGELRNMLVDPATWVSSLAGLPTWDARIPAPTLADDYAVMAERTDRSTLDGWVMVQGISGTNAITVVASQPSAVLAAALDVGQVPDVLAAFWAKVALDASTGRTKELKIETLATYGRWFGHMEVGDAVSTPAATATRASAFLLASLYDVVGYAAMLNGLTKEISAGRGEVAPAKVGVRPGPPPTSTTYVSRGAMARPGVREDPPQPPTFCTVTGGTYAPPGDATIEGGVVKRYGVE